jgi:hypothetical protein
MGELAARTVCSTEDWSTVLIFEDYTYSKTDASFSLGQATAIAVGWTPIFAFVVLGLYCLIWGVNSLLAATSYFRHWEIFLHVILGSIGVHEGLHWIGYVGFGRISWKTVRFGFTVRAFAAYVHSDSPVSISAYRGLVAMPGVVLGLIPVCVGVAWGIGWITLYGFLMLISAIGDFAILWRIRRVSPDSLVIDHPSRAGCWVLGERTDADFHSLDAEAQGDGK